MNNSDKYRIVQELMKPRHEDQSIPISTFNKQNLEEALNVSMLSTIRQFNGLELKNEIPDLHAIEEFLKYKYNYFLDDLEHDDPFV